jgi:glucan phosphoethanolaminetransferase (alkaline phosphatase superfamily)
MRVGWVGQRMFSVKSWEKLSSNQFFVDQSLSYGLVCYFLFHFQLFDAVSIWSDHILIVIVVIIIIIAWFIILIIRIHFGFRWFGPSIVVR